MTKEEIEKLIVALAKIPPMPDECEPPKIKPPLTRDQQLALVAKIKRGTK